MKRRRARKVRVGAADSIRIAKYKTQVAGILHELRIQRGIESHVAESADSRL